MIEAPIHLAGTHIPDDFIWDPGTVTPLQVEHTGHLAEYARQMATQAGFTLFWDFSMGMPDINLLRQLPGTAGDLWHGGLSTGWRDYQPLWVNISPGWMLNAPVQDGKRCVSWKVDFRCLLIRNEVFHQIGAPDASLATVAAAGAEFGLRCLKSGAIPIYVPELTPGQPATIALPIPDEIRIMRRYYPSFWVKWALGAATLQGRTTPAQAWHGWQTSRQTTMQHLPVYRRHQQTFPAPGHARVSALIITLGRYPYIKTVLRCLAVQTIPVSEVIIIDGTAAPENIDWQADLPPGTSLPVRYERAEKVGQCSQRNQGMRLAGGDYIWIIDDDMEDISPDHLHRHLYNIFIEKADVSCGLQDEAGIPPVDRTNLPVRVSDVLPTGDVLIKKDYLTAIGGFEIRMDKGQNEDHELGTRLFRAGALILLDPAIKALHLRAPTGGLRTHGARKITYHSSRNHLWHRRLPHITEIFLNLLHHPMQEVKTSLVISALGTLSIRGSRSRKLLKIAIGLFLMPHTCWEIRRRYRAARRMIRENLAYTDVRF